MKITTLLLLLIISINSFSQNLREVMQQMVQPTIFLAKETPQGLIPHGTGISVLSYKTQKDLIVTCEHNLKNDKIFVLIEVDPKTRGIIENSSAREVGSFLKDLAAINIFWNGLDKFMAVRIPLIKDSTFFVHPDCLDIGVIKTVIPTFIMKDTARVRFTPLKKIGLSRMDFKENIVPGQEIYIVGFPFGFGMPSLSPDKKIFSASTPKHIMRKGIVSMTTEDYDEFLLDVVSYGGNSGSPVFKSDYLSAEMGKLIGMVIGHLGEDNENFNLARALSSTEIIKVVRIADK